MGQIDELVFRSAIFNDPDIHGDKVQAKKIEKNGEWRPGPHVFFHPE